MTGFYIYASKAKVDVLESALSRGNPLKSIRLKIATPVVEVAAELQADKNFQKSLAKVKKKLQEQRFRPFEDESTGLGPPIISFAGPASLAISGEAVQVALAAGNTALLLIGSAQNLTGAVSVPGTKATAISMVPTSGIPNEAGLTENHAISFAWQQLWRKSPDGTKINVAGFALFSGAYGATMVEMRRAGHRELTRVVLASPVYIEQV
jgi:hypothetical protein